jgi:hypothetical protein
MRIFETAFLETESTLVEARRSQKKLKKAVLRSLQEALSDP